MLRGATAADFAFVRGLTGRPDYAAFITDEDEAALAGYLTDPTARLLIWEPGNGPKGFAIFCEIGHPSGRVELMRLALDQTGKGQGARFFDVLLDHAFTQLGAARVWFDASGENQRAMTVYERAGCVREGILRQHWWRPVLGRTVDLHLFGILREEWQELQAQTCGLESQVLHSS